jgi:hypothetical protein
MTMPERRIMHPDLSFKVMVWALGTVLLLVGSISAFAANQFLRVVDKFDELSRSVQALATVTAESTAERRFTQIEIARLDEGVKVVASTLTQHMLDDNKQTSTIRKHEQEDSRRFAAVEGGGK